MPVDSTLMWKMTTDASRFNIDVKDECTSANRFNVDMIMTVQTPIDSCIKIWPIFSCLN